MDETDEKIRDRCMDVQMKGWMDGMIKNGYRDTSHWWILWWMKIYKKGSNNGWMEEMMKGFKDD